VNFGLAALAVAVVGCGVIAVSAHESRVAVLGLVLCAVIAPLIGTELPTPLVLSARLVAAILSGYVLWIAVRHQPATRGSRIGWPAEALAAAAAAVAGYGAAGFIGPAAGPREAEAVAFALGYLALGPLLVERDVLRLAIGLVVIVLAGSMARLAVQGTSSQLEQLVLSGVTVAVAGAAATIAAHTVRASRSFEVAPPARGGSGRSSGSAPRGDRAPETARPGPSGIVTGR
jgi:hypothetical protein